MCKEFPFGLKEESISISSVRKAEMKESKNVSFGVVKQEMILSNEVFPVWQGNVGNGPLPV